MHANKERNKNNKRRVLRASELNIRPAQNPSEIQFLRYACAGSPYLCGRASYRPFFLHIDYAQGFQQGESADGSYAAHGHKYGAGCRCRLFAVAQVHHPSLHNGKHTRLHNVDAIPNMRALLDHKDESKNRISSQRRRPERSCLRQCGVRVKLPVESPALLTSNSHHVTRINRTVNKRLYKKREVEQKAWEKHGGPDGFDA